MSSFVYDPWVLYAARPHHRSEPRARGHRRLRQVRPREEPLHPLIPFGRRVYVPGDPKGEHTAVAEAVGGKAIALGHGMTNRLNPLDEGHRPTGLRRCAVGGPGASRRRELVGALARPCSTVA